MKVLSLKQPWAELVVSGRKQIEIRKWNTNFRGRFLIHSSKISDKDAMKKFGFSELDLGCIIGEVELVDVIKYTPKEFEKDREKHLAISEFGEHGFVLKNAKRLQKAYCKGSLGFWESDVYS